MSGQQIDRCGDCHSCCKSFGWIDDNQITLFELDINTNGTDVVNSVITIDAPYMTKDHKHAVTSNVFM